MTCSETFVKNKKRAFLNFIIVLTAIFIMLTLSACRESPVLQQRIYVNNAEIDHDNTQHENDEDNKLEDEIIAALTKNDKSKTERDYDYSGATKGDSNSEKDAADNKFGNTSDNENSAGTQGSGTSTENDNTDTDGIEEAPGVKPTKNQNIIMTADPSGVNAGEIPSDVDTVVALGDVALYVEMLGGKGRVVAGSESFLTNKFSNTVFGSTEISSIYKLCKGSGSNAVLENGDAVVDHLINGMGENKPAVIFTTPDQTNLFTSAQYEKLKENGIVQVALPRFNTWENRKKALQVISTVLGDNKQSVEGYKNAKRMADNYIDWYEELVSSLSDNIYTGDNKYDYDYERTGEAQYATTGYNRPQDSNKDTGFYSLYISEWDDSATYSVKSTGGVSVFSGNGMAVAPSGYSTTPNSYYMSLGGVANKAALPSDYFSERHWFVSPIYNRNYITSSAHTENKDNRGNYDALNILTSGLGLSSFNKVIVANSSIKEHIESERDSATQTLWKPCNNETGRGNGFVVGSDLIISNVEGNFEVVVNPSGVGSWNSGSPEAPLEAVWISNTFYGDEIFTKDQLKSKIAQFYKDFYGMTSVSSSLIDDILNGEE